MISFICGNVRHCTDNIIVLQSGDIGYELTVSNMTMASVSMDTNIMLYTYLQVREDGLSLYGFATKDEKALFARLITVSGIGCRVAINMLSSMNSNQLAMAIFNGDIKLLSSIKGLGKKTAERLVLELRGKVEATDNNSSVPVDNTVNDVVALLTSLGLSQSDALDRVERARQLGATTTEQYVNMALKMR